MYERADDMKLNFSPKTAFYRLGDIATRVQSNEVEANAPCRAPVQYYRDLANATATAIPD
jgi:hypothetical protein